MKKRKDSRLGKKVYAIAQAYAINTGKEKITSQIIRKVAKKEFKIGTTNDYCIKN